MPESTYKVTLQDKQAVNAMDGLIKQATRLDSAFAKIGKVSSFKSLTAQAKSTRKAMAALAKGADFKKLGADVKGARAALDGLAAGAANAKAKLAGMGGAASGAFGQIKSSGNAAGGSIMTSMSGAASAVQSVIRGATRLSEALFSVAKQGQGIKNLEVAFQALGGTQGDLEKLRESTGNLVTDKVLIKMQNMATAIGITSTQFQGLSKVATGAAFTLGRDFSETLERLVLGAGKMEKELLDELGITFESMTVLKQDFAKKAGKAASEVTDAEKKMIFINKVLEKGAVQASNSILAQGDAIALTETKVINFVDGLKKQVAQAVVSSGVLDDLGGSMGSLGDVFGDTNRLQTLVGSGARALKDVFTALVAAFEPMIDPLIEILAGFELISPVLIFVARAAGSLTGALISVTVTAMAPLIEALGFLINAGAKAAGALGFSGLAKQLGAAGASFDRYRDQVESSGNATQALTGLTKLNADGQAKLAETTKKAAQATLGMSAATKEAEDALLAEAVATQKADTFTELLKASKKASRAATIAQALSERELIQVFASEAKEARKLQIELIKLGQIRGIQFETGAVVDLSPEQTVKAALSVQALKRDMGDASIAARTLTEQFSVLGATEEQAFTLATDAFEQQRKALEELKAPLLENQRLLEQGGLGVGTRIAPGDLGLREIQELEDFLQEAENKTLDMIRATSQKALDEEKKGGGKRAKATKAFGDKMGKLIGADGAKRAKALAGAEKEATLALLSDQDEKHQKIINKRLDLIAVLEGQNDKLAGALKFDIAQRNVAQALGQAFISMSEALKPLNDELQRTAQTFSRIAGAGNITEMTNQFQQLAAEQRTLADLAKREGDVTGEEDALRQAEGFARTADELSAIDADLQSTKRGFEALIGVTTSVGTSMSSLFGQLAEGAKSTDDIMRDVFGALFADLSAVFISWMAAEIAALTNPFLGIVAAIAFSAVAASIGGLIKRKPGGGAGAGGGGTSTQRQAVERDGDRRKDRDEPQVIVFNFGFSAPDEVAQSAAAAEKRAIRLRGRKG